MGDHTDYYVDPALEKMFHKDLSTLNLNDQGNDSSDALGSHLPEWLVGVIIVIVMLIVAFFVMVITSLIKKRKKNQSSLNGDALSSTVACDDLESGKIGPNVNSTTKSSSLKNGNEDTTCPPEKDFTSTSHKALQEVSGDEGLGCQNPLFVDDDDLTAVEGQQALESCMDPGLDMLRGVEIVMTGDGAKSKSLHKHRTCKVYPTITENETSSSCPNSPANTSKAKSTEVNEKIDSSEAPSCQPCDTLSEHDDVFNDSNNESCHSISSCSDEANGLDQVSGSSHNIHIMESLDENESPFQSTSLLSDHLDSNVALNSFNMLGAACNSDGEDVERDTGVILNGHTDKPDLLQRSLSNGSEGQLWLASNGNSLQDIVTAHLTTSLANSDNRKTSDDSISDTTNLGSDSKSTMNGGPTVFSTDSCPRETNGCDGLSTNL